MTNKPLPYFVHSSSFVDEPCDIGDGTHIWHFTHIMAHCKIGKQCNIGQNVMVASGVVIGNRVKIQNNVSVYAGVLCEDDVFIGPSVVFTNVLNPRSAVNRRGQYAQTTIKTGASIGANATILCGNTIGKYAFIGAGAVVTRDVLDYALVIGNPGRQTGWMSEYGNPLHFENGRAVCTESQQEYTLQNGLVCRTK